MEALIFASDKPVDEARLGDRLPEDSDIGEIMRTLQAAYETRGVNLVRVGKAWAFRTAPDLAGSLVIERERRRKLSRAAIETLAVVAYHQPVTRAEIEEIRGVTQSKGTVDVLLEAGWIKPGRRRQTPGRPVTWMTTTEFLDHFGIESLKDLPGAAELRAAGFLDSRPAIQAYRGDAAGLELPLEDEDEHRDEDPDEAGAAHEEDDLLVDSEPEENQAAASNS
jgi:segregation and condensation protein B